MYSQLPVKLNHRLWDGYETIAQLPAKRLCATFTLKRYLISIP